MEKKDLEGDILILLPPQRPELNQERAGTNHGALAATRLVFFGSDLF